VAASGSEGYFKINFDGASKGNPGPTGFGATIRNNKGDILLLIAGNMGHNTNNIVELWGMLKGLQAALDQGLKLLFVEGDSQIIINLLSHLLNGADLEWVSPRWRLTNGLVQIKTMLQPHLVIIPSHVRRKVNQVVDKLVNFRVDLKEGDFCCNPDSSPDHPLVRACISQALNMDHSPDGVSP
jgi:ribonuclease HI